MKTSPHRNTSAIVDLKAIRNNIEKFKKHIHPNAEIWPAVKADAYGHGSVEVSKAVSDLVGLKGYETIIGGGTFGRLLERGVAYGAMFEGEPDSMHQANEMKPVENIYKAAVIYAEAIYELTK